MAATLMPPERVVVPTEEEVKMLRRVFIATGAYLNSDWTIEKHLEVIFAHLHSESAYGDFVETFVADCAQVFAYMDLEPEAAMSYCSALCTFAETLFLRLADLGFYRSSLRNFKFDGFVGNDTILHFIDEYY